MGNVRIFLTIDYGEFVRGQSEVSARRYRWPAGGRLPPARSFFLGSSSHRM
jgi:hypothetical protein